jgi:hypothetical protein
VSLATTVVTSDLTSESLMFSVMSTVFDNFYRLQSLYLPAVNLAPPDLATKQLSPRRDQSGNYAEGHRSAPLHDGAWSYYVQRAMVEKPYYAVVGSFRDLRSASRLASLLATRYPQTFARGLQVRFSTNRVFAVIAGDAINSSAVRSRMNAIRKAVPEIKDPRPIEAGSATWSPDLLARDARVYIHVVDNVHAKSAVPVQKTLEQAGWIVPGIERVGNRSPRNAQLRYFRPSEKLVVAGILQSLRKLKLSPAPTYIRGYENATNIRPLHFELWFPKGQP